MTNNIENCLFSGPVIPLIQAKDPGVAVDTAVALSSGGLSVIEVVFRTNEALDCLKRIASDLPNVIVGAGTILNSYQASVAIDSGAQFIVSPGLSIGVVDTAKRHGVVVFPGIMTPSEAMHAEELSVSVVKFFPASTAGGPPALKAIHSILPNMRFIPTGGVSASNLGDYLALDCVLACGGSWLTPTAATEAKDYEKITALAAEAVHIANQTRG